MMALTLAEMKYTIHKIILVLAVALPQVVFSQAPEVGDIAPDFELKGSDGVVYKLSDFKEKKAVVVAWFPKAFTGG